MILIGSVSRVKLLLLLNEKVGQDARQRETNNRIKLAIENIDKHFEIMQHQQENKTLPIEISESSLFTTQKNTKEGSTKYYILNFFIYFMIVVILLAINMKFFKQI